MRLIAQAEIVLADNAVVKPNEFFEVGKHVSVGTAKSLIEGGYAREAVALTEAETPAETPAPKGKKTAKGEDL